MDYRYLIPLAALLIANGCNPAQSADAPPPPAHRLPAPLPPGPPVAQARPAGAPGDLLKDPASGADCGGHDVLLSHNDFSLVLDGKCGTVLITASNGSLNVDKARKIRVEGSNVTVLNQDVDALEVVGSDNTLNMTQVATATVDGNNNGLLGKHYGNVAFKGSHNYVNSDNKPPFTDSGTGNKVI